MQRQDRDPYEVLGLDVYATSDEIKAAYRRLAKKHHPDKNQGDKASEWIFKEVNQAYATLRDNMSGGNRSSRGYEARRERQEHERAEREGREWDERTREQARREQQAREEAEHIRREQEERERRQARAEQERQRREQEHDRDVGRVDEDVAVAVVALELHQGSSVAPRSPSTSLRFQLTRPGRLFRRHRARTPGRGMRTCAPGPQRPVRSGRSWAKVAPRGHTDQRRTKTNHASDPMSAGR